MSLRPAPGQTRGRRARRAMRSTLEREHGQRTDHSLGEMYGGLFEGQGGGHATAGCAGVGHLKKYTRINLSPRVEKSGIDLYNLFAGC